MSNFDWQRLWVNVNLITMTDSDNSYGEILNGAIAIADGKICWLGPQQDLPSYDEENVEVIDGKGQWLTPGLIDCHTHIVYGGQRANEFEMRLEGATYEQIAQAGGGIVSTVEATRKASHQTLLKSALKRLTALHQQGVTTVEVKSGYGLDTETEMKMLQVATQLADHLPVSIKRTFLGAHALPKEFNGKADDYIHYVCEEMLPEVAKANLVDAVDVFCEGIGFNIQQTQAVFEAAKKYNLPVKVHAEQLSNIGGTELATSYGALSSDHVEFLDESGIEKMATAGTVAVLLPGAFYFIRETQLPPVALLRKHKVPMAIATDSNPGSSPISSIQLMLNMACTLFRLTPVEALAGVTCNAAKALNIGDSTGQLAVGFDADFALWDIELPAELCYQFGVNPLSSLIKSGKTVI